jgi:hypothetical protein
VAGATAAIFSVVVIGGVIGPNHLMSFAQYCDKKKICHSERSSVIRPADGGTQSRNLLLNRAQVSRLHKIVRERTIQLALEMTQQS